jgi:hypothetical protein
VLTPDNHPNLGGQEIVGGTGTVIPKNKILDGEGFETQDGTLSPEISISLKGMRIQSMVGSMRARNRYADDVGTDSDSSIFKTDALDMPNIFKRMEEERKKQADRITSFDDDLAAIMSVMDVVLME